MKYNLGYQEGSGYAVEGYGYAKDLNPISI